MLKVQSLVSFTQKIIDSNHVTGKYIFPEKILIPIMSRQKAWLISVDKRWDNWHGIKHTWKESGTVAKI